MCADRSETDQTPERPPFSSLCRGVEKWLYSLWKAAGGESLQTCDDTFLSTPLNTCLTEKGEVGKH